MNLTDGTPQEPLPPTAISQFMLVDEEDEILDARDWILSDPTTRLSLTPQELHEACGGVYSTETLSQALAQTV